MIFYPKHQKFPCKWTPLVSDCNHFLASWFYSFPLFLTSCKWTLEAFWGKYYARYPGYTFTENLKLHVCVNLFSKGPPVVWFLLKTTSHKQGFWQVVEKKVNFCGIFTDKFAEKLADSAVISREFSGQTFRQVNSPNSWNKFQICCTDMNLIRYTLNLVVFFVFLWISQFRDRMKYQEPCISDH